MMSYLIQNARSVYETCQQSRFALSNGKKFEGVHQVTYTEYSYIKLRYLVVTPNGKSLVYVKVLQNGRLEHLPDCVFSAIVTG